MPLIVPDLKIKSLYGQVEVDKVLRYQSDERDRTEIELQQKGGVLAALSLAVQYKIVPLGSHANSSLP